MEMNRGVYAAAAVWEAGGRPYLWGDTLTEDECIEPKEADPVVHYTTGALVLFRCTNGRLVIYRVIRVK